MESMLPEIWQGVRRILVVRLDNIGDMVMLSPALRAIKTALPEALLTVLASPAGSTVTPLMPWVAETLTLRAVWQDVRGELPFDPNREFDLIEELRRRQFDAMIIFTSFSQSPYPPAMAGYLAGIPIRVGHTREFGGQILSRCYPPPPPEGHQAERNLALLRNAGLPVQAERLALVIPDEVQAAAGELLRAHGIDPEEPYIVLAPGASCAARRYEPARFAEVARQLPLLSGLPVVITGSERERETLHPVLAETGSRRHGCPVSLLGKTTLPELAAIIKRSQLVVANNSASIHLADAFQVPQVVLYSGAELISQWQPRSSPAILLQRATACLPCHLFQCRYNLECLDFSPREVLEVILSQLVEPQKAVVGLPVALDARYDFVQAERSIA